MNWFYSVPGLVLKLDGKKLSAKKKRKLAKRKLSLQVCIGNSPGWRNPIGISFSYHTCEAYIEAYGP